MDLTRGSFRVRGDVLEINPAEKSDYIYRVEFFGDEVDRIVTLDPVTYKVIAQLKHLSVFPASHYVVSSEKMEKACLAIEAEAKERVAYFKSEDKLIEAQRIGERTAFDVEMLRETGVCSGIENYSRHLTGLKPGQPPHCLMDFFKGDFLIIIDEELSDFRC